MKDFSKIVMLKKERPLSRTQLRMLRGAHEGDPLAGVRGQSAHGGAWGTTTSLVRRGLMTDDYKLTDAGRAAIACTLCNKIHDDEGPITGCVLR